jgi:hypothetical protein
MIVVVAATVSEFLSVGLAGSLGALVEGLSDFKDRIGLREGQLRLVVITR